MMGTNSCLIIAEVAQAHEGSLAIAHSYIDSIASSGADAVKFQMHIAEEESSNDDKFRIPSKYSQDKNRFDYWKRMEFSFSEWKGLKQHAEDLGLLFLCSPFSIKAVEILIKLDIRAWKIASGEASNLYMLDKICESQKPIFLSTGMSNLDEIAQTLDFIRSKSIKDIVLMQCTSQYPCPPELVGINMLTELRDSFNVEVGLSDHSGTIFPSLSAVTLGAKAVEVHVTFDRKIFGFDASSSINFSELRNLVDGLRFIEIMLGNPIDKNKKNEQIMHIEKLFKKGIYLKKELKKNEEIKLENLKFLKPLTGIPADCFQQILNKKTNKTLPKDAILHWSDIDNEA